MNASQPSSRVADTVRTEKLTLLLTDIEGSTRLWETQPDQMYEALARHDQIISVAVERFGGRVIQSKGEGDSTFSVFSLPGDAVSATLEAQRALSEEPWPTAAPIRVRMAVHTGDVEIRHGDYFGIEISRCARLRSSAHGGQALVSDATARQVSGSLPPGASLEDLGLHRLKDFERLERVFQIRHPALPARFPPLTSLSAVRHNLPAQVSPFIGRRSDVAAIKSRLSAARLVTLIGTGGCGKTRLALHVAYDLVGEFRDGVWLVELAAVTDEALVPSAVGQAVGVREEVGRPIGTTLERDLASRQMLIVLDNCEHLIGACTRLAAALLRACRDVTILATSRQRLAMPGESVWRVASLAVPRVDPLPPLDEIRQHEAVALFLERATRQRPDFDLTPSNARIVAEISRRLDGIPLAIELAAARVSVLTPDQILERLDDRFRLLTSGGANLGRHQTLRAAIDWSYDLLSDAERDLFARLSVFVGGFTIDAVEAVGATEPVEPIDVLDQVARLVDKSLVVADVRKGVARYHMLDTVLAYAQEKLAGSDADTEARRALLAWHVSFAETARGELTGPDQILWYDRIEDEYPNMRASLHWGFGSAFHEDVVRLCAALAVFWLERGHMGEGRNWLGRALAIGTVPPLVRASALRAAGALAMWQSDLPDARGHHEEAVRIARSVGDEIGAAMSLSHLGIVAWRSGDAHTARSLLEESLEIRRRLGDRPGESLSLGNLGLVFQSQGDYDTARRLLEESLAIDRELGDKLGIAGSFSYLGELERAAGNFDRAEELHLEGLRGLRELPQREVLPMAIEGLAGLAAARGRVESAARLFGAAESLRRTVGLPVPPSSLEAYERDVAGTRRALGDTAFEQLKKEGWEMTLEAAISYALAEAGD
jgi:predicted ATPase/class 3 adenylate cyclase